MLDVVFGETTNLYTPGNIRYQLKTPYSDGTTQVMLLRAYCPSAIRASLRLFKIDSGDFVAPKVCIAEGFIPYHYTLRKVNGLPGGVLPDEGWLV